MHYSHFYLPECLCFERVRETDIETNELAAVELALADYRLVKSVGARSKAALSPS